MLVDKPAGPTSHDIVSSIRQLFKKVVGYGDVPKVGHLGTLDPFATGLLPIMIGGATKLSEQFMNGNKQYLFTIQLGKETDTLDPSGKVISEREVPPLSWDALTEILTTFHGNIEQVPPSYSALKMQGRPLYEYMRAQGSLPLDIQTKKRQIHIFQCDLVSLDPNLCQASFRVLCSKGTYVRALSRDIAKALDTVGYCVALRRESVAPWNVKSALTLENLEASHLREALIPVSSALPHVPHLVIQEHVARPILYGNILNLEREDFFKYVSFFLSSLKAVDLENIFTLNPQTIENCFLSIENSKVLYYGTLVRKGSTFILRPQKRMI